MFPFDNHCSFCFIRTSRFCDGDGSVLYRASAWLYEFVVDESCPSLRFDWPRRTPRPAPHLKQTYEFTQPFLYSFWSRPPGPPSRGLTVSSSFARAAVSPQFSATGAAPISSGGCFRRAMRSHVSLHFRSRVLLGEFFPLRVLLDAYLHFVFDFFIVTLRIGFVFFPGCRQPIQRRCETRGGIRKELLQDHAGVDL